MAWWISPEVAACSIIEHRDAPSEEGVIDYDEFLVFEHAVTSIPATQINEKAILRFRRRVTNELFRRFG